jgi:hypothetical protein
LESVGGVFQEAATGLIQTADLFHELRGHLAIGVNVGDGAKAVGLNFAGFLDASTDGGAIFASAGLTKGSGFHRGNRNMDVYAV